MVQNFNQIKSIKSLGPSTILKNNQGFIAIIFVFITNLGWISLRQLDLRSDPINGRTPFRRTPAKDLHAYIRTYKQTTKQVILTQDAWRHPSSIDMQITPSSALLPHAASRPHSTSRQLIASHRLLHPDLCSRLI